MEGPPGGHAGNHPQAGTPWATAVPGIMPGSPFPSHHCQPLSSGPRCWVLPTEALGMGTRHPRALGQAPGQVPLRFGVCPSDCLRISVALVGAFLAPRCLRQAGGQECFEPSGLLSRPLLAPSLLWCKTEAKSTPSSVNSALQPRD